MLAPWKKRYDQLGRHIKKQRRYFANKGSYSQSYGFSSSRVLMRELDYKKDWVHKNWCFWTVVFEQTIKSPMDCKEIKPINPRGNQLWIFIGRTDVEAEAPILCQLMWRTKNWLIGKDPDAGKDWGKEKKEATERDGWMASLIEWTWVWASSWR